MSIFRPHMSGFDPNEVQKAVAEFTPRRQQKFEDLMPAKAVIAELRQRRASFRAIAELLTQHCLPTSKTAIAEFCHDVLGEAVRPNRRKSRKKFAAARPPADSTAVPSGRAAPLTAEPPNFDNGSERPRGPRIAQIRKLAPQLDEKVDSHP